MPLLILQIKPTKERLEADLLTILPSYGDPARNEASVIENIMSKGLGVKHCIVREFSGGLEPKYMEFFFLKILNGLTYVVKTMKGHTSELAKELSSLQNSVI